MLNRFFQDRRVLDRFRSSVLGAAFDEFAKHLHEHGYSPQVIQKYSRAAGHFAYWLGCEGIPPAALSGSTARLFLDEHLPSCHCSVPVGEPLSCVRPALDHLLSLAVGQHIPRAAKTVVAPNPLLESFEAYLLGIRGVAPSTRLAYSGAVRAFLRVRYGDGPIDLTLLAPHDLVVYLCDYAARVKPGSVKQAATALRGFLRSLQLQGVCDPRLVAAVPSVAYWRLSHIPKLLSEEQLGRLLASFDRSTRLGRRDYAMTLCLIRLGLRASEVARLSLDDIDWRSGTLCIEGGKRGRCHVLPLPAELGRALVSYLKRGRPRSAHRRLFLRHTAPVGEPINSGVVQGVIRRAHDRGQVGARWKGTHALRHTAATRLLRSGATLKEIADVLGHRSLDTTAIYAKVDLGRLAEVALPWPEVRS